jgi:hypothetical protein
MGSPVIIRCTARLLKLLAAHGEIAEVPTVRDPLRPPRHLLGSLTENNLNEENVA